MFGRFRARPRPFCHGGRGWQYVRVMPPRTPNAGHTPVRAPVAPAAAVPRHTGLALSVPLLLMLAIAVAPLVAGKRTLYLRDVTYTHLEMKWTQAMAMRAGTFPILDPYRGGGQALAGNPNAVPFYPTNVLYLVAPVFWALNAHFWIHLLLAPLACFWMSRRWGLSREGAWAAAACYSTSGFYLSHLSLYNLIPGATLTPALVAVSLAIASGERRAVMVPLAAIVWALLLTGGDPLTPVMALLVAAAAIAVNGRRTAAPRAGGWGWFALALAWGTVIAMPQIVEFLRVAPQTFRGQGMGAAERTLASLDPRQAAEWILPFAFGRPDVLGPGQFWAREFYMGTAPYFLSLYPGLLALALLGAALSWRRGPEAWAWACVVVGVGLALGRFNPLARALFESSLFASLRFPIKLWLPVAIGYALLGGIGLQRMIDGVPAARRSFLAALGILAAVLALACAALALLPRELDTQIRAIVPGTYDDAFVDHERRRWLGLALVSLAVLGFGFGIARQMFRRNPWPWAAAVLIGGHAASQLLFLRPLFPMDAPEPYLERPAALALVPDSARVVNPDQRSMFGPTRQLVGPFPSSERFWQWRRAVAQLYPMTGPIWGRHFDLDSSPEGLSSAHTVEAQGAVWRADDTTRVRLLARWGIDRLVLDRRLDPSAEARLLAEVPGGGQPVYVYEIPGAVPEALLARDVYPAPDDRAAAALVSVPEFDARRDVALLGPGEPRSLGGGTARVVARGPETLEVEAQAGPGGAVLVVQRTDLLYRAEIDGRAVPVRTANVHRIGVEIPEGRHRVRLFVDRSPFERSAMAAAAALLLLPGLGWLARGGAAGVTERAPTAARPRKASRPR